MDYKKSILFLGILVFLVGLILRLAGVAITASSVMLIAGAVFVLVFIIADYKGVMKSLGKRSTRYGAAQGTMVVLVFAIAAFILAYSNSHTKRFDLTENQRFTLDPATKNVLSSLDKEVRIVIFYDSAAESMFRQNIEDILKQYNHMNDNVEYEFIDPIQNPGDAMPYKTELYTTPTIFVEQGVNREKTTGNEEQDITNALIKVTRVKQHKVYFLKGHGEKDFENASDFQGMGQIKTRLENKNYLVESLEIQRQVGVPDDASVVIIAAPQTDLFDEELQALGRYLNLGGNVIVLLEPETAPKLAAWAGQYGLNVGRDIVCEAEFQADLMSLLKGQFQGQISVSTQPSVTSYPDDVEITRNFQLRTQYPSSRSVSIDSSPPEGVTARKLLETKGKLQNSDFPGSWAETNIEALKEKKAEFQEGQDIRGPVTIAGLATIDRMKFEPAKAAEAQIQASTGEMAERPENSHLLVFGDSDFASNSMVAYGGGDLFMNSVNYLTEEEDLITISSKPTEDTSLNITGVQSRIIQVLTFVAPLAVIALGIGVALRRRRSA